MGDRVAVVVFAVEALVWLEPPAAADDEDNSGHVMSRCVHVYGHAVTVVEEVVLVVMDDDDNVLFFGAKKDPVTCK